MAEMGVKSEKNINRKAFLENYLYFRFRKHFSLQEACRIENEPDKHPFLAQRR